MLTRLVPEISSLDAFCDTAGTFCDTAAAAIGDSRSWIVAFFSQSISSREMGVGVANLRSILFGC